MSNETHQEAAVAASAAEIAVAGAADARQAPSEILLMPAGEVRARPHDGRAPWYNRDAEAIVAATQALKAPIAIDYEHQGVRSAKNGQPAPAAGWINRTFVRDGAVWGEVEWTAKAKAHIEAREYRFISPVFRHHRQTRAVTRIEGAALVNDPALHMRAIAGATSGGFPAVTGATGAAGATGAGLETEDDKENPMTQDKDKGSLNTGKRSDAVQDTAALAAALGLKADADEASILAAVKTAAKGATALAGVAKTLAKTLGLDEDADGSAIAAAAAAAAGGDGPDPKQWVPRAEFDRAAKRLETVETERADERAATAVSEATAAGKIAPAQGDWALAYASKDPEGFADYVKAAPAIVTPGRVLSGSPPAGGGGTATTAAKAGLAIPVGRAVDADQLALHERALARAKADKIDYAEAAALEEATS